MILIMIIIVTFKAPVYVPGGKQTAILTSSLEAAAMALHLSRVAPLGRATRSLACRDVGFLSHVVFHLQDKTCLTNELSTGQLVTCSHTSVTINFQYLHSCLIRQADWL